MVVTVSAEVFTMARVFRPTYTRAGNRVTVQDWYAEWWGADGQQHRKRIGRKSLAIAFLAEQQVREERIRAGVCADANAAKLRLLPLADLVAEYMDLMAARNLDATYRANVREMLARILEGCSWATWANVTGDSLVLYLGRRRAELDNAAATLNSFLRTARGFTRWLADRMGERDPLRAVKRFDESKRVRSKRILTDAEFDQLLKATDAAKPRGKFSGPDRAMLYRLAGFTGLRVGELATLTPLHFALDSAPPTVTVEAADAKGKRLEPLPLPAHVVAVVRPWLAKKSQRKPLWPGAWVRSKQYVRWLESDLKRAGVAAQDAQGRKATFHGLRRRYVTSVIKTGAGIHEVKRLARHRDLKTTLEYYTDETLADLGAIADRL